MSQIITDATFDLERTISVSFPNIELPSAHFSNIPIQPRTFHHIQVLVVGGFTLSVQIFQHGLRLSKNIKVMIEVFASYPLLINVSLSGCVILKNEYSQSSMTWDDKIQVHD
jgi:hypothetical protein